MGRTLLEALEQAARTERGVQFVDGAPARLSYASLLAAAERMGSAFAERYEVGRPILLVLPNGSDAVTAFFAALYAGLVPSVLPLPRPFGDLGRYVAGLVRVSRRADDAPIVAPAMVKTMLARGESAHLEVLDPATLDAAPSGARPHEVALVQFTSGSLGDPKGVVLSQDAVLGNGEAIAARLGATPDDVGCFWVPLAHDMGLIGSMVFLLSVGAEQVLMAVEQFAIDPGRWLRVSAERGATLLSGPPFAFDMAAKRLLKDAERGVALPDLSRLRGCVVGAEPIDARILRRVSEALAPAGFGAGGDPWVMAYGMAEYACVATTARGLRTVRVRPATAPGEAVVEDAGGLELVSCGKPLEGARVRVVDGQGAPVGERVAGRIEVAGRSAMRGYWRDPEHTAAALDEGWIRTGDVGFLDRGDVFVSGRDKDVIILRGRHFFPEEIEAIVRELPGVRTGGVVAFGVVDPSGGPERVVVVVEASSDADFAKLSREVKAHVADRLDLLVHAVVQAPLRAIPRTTSGKPRRGEARQRWGGAAASG